MRFRWPEDTVFHRLVLDVEQDACAHCGSALHICDHRFHRIYTLEQPVELCCRLAHCSDPGCSARSRTLSPAAELSLTLPGWLLGWDVFCFIGHRRFARHWSVPQLRSELRDAYRIALSPDAIAVYIHRYQNMVSARQQDFANLQQVYQDIDRLDLTIDGLQPEKGHETLYAIRELKAKRVWFAEALLSSNEAEVRRLLVRADDLAKQLGKPVRLWMSDKQDAFVKGIAAQFPGVPHLYCGNHFLRDLAKPTLASDSHAKVQLRKKVRGLRDVERQVLHQRQQATAAPNSRPEPTPTETLARVEGTAVAPETTAAVAAQDVVSGPTAQADPGVPSGGVVESVPTAPTQQPAEGTDQTVALSCPSPPTGSSTAAPTVVGVGKAVDEQAGQVVLDYCAAVRGILNDDQGGPLHPPGLRMAEALQEVRASLQRNLEWHQPGPAHGQLEQLAGCIDRGLQEVQAEQQHVQKQVAEIQRVAATLEEKSGPVEQRQQQYEQLQKEYEAKGGAFYGPVAKVMLAWALGLFAKVEGGPRPADNQELERWFRQPKGHERRIHGHQHAGVRIVQEGPTLLPTLDAHQEHDGPFTAQDLLPYRHAQPPQDQQEALHRRKVMRKARSKKN